MALFPVSKKARLVGFLKTMICKLILSPVYRICCICPVRNDLVVLADGHQSSMPHSMIMVKRKLDEISNIKVKEYYHDYSFSNPFKGLWTMIRFMPLYARARYVFISDCFIPVSACKKRKGTMVIQLWHSSGLMKKIGWDSPQEVNSLFRLQYRNYDVFTVSSPLVGDVLAGAMRLPRDVFTDTGVTLIDFNYCDDLIQDFRREFFAKYPEYKGKKIILWAPTFRGTPRNGYLTGHKEISHLNEDLSDEYAIIIKTHRYSKNKKYDTSISYRADMLIHIADILITDYSSIYFDFLSTKHPIVLFCPDLDKYQSERGLYIDYESLPGKHAKNYNELVKAVLESDSWANNEYRYDIDRIWEEHMCLCEGNSCEKLFDKIHLTD